MRALRYVGDVSRGDAAVLAALARGAKRILEYGVGASTQIFAQAAAAETEILSLDEDDYWIERTRVLLNEVAPHHPVRLVKFQRLSVLDDLKNGSFDLIFNDGAAHLRLEFGLLSWRLLPMGGRMVLHDTRRPRDMSNVLAIVARFFREVDRIDVNPKDSHLTILYKGQFKQPENWNKAEGRASWQVGDEDIDTTLRRLRRQH